MKTLANEPELTDNEAGESDSDGVYEFTQDAHYNDQRDPQRWKAPGRKTLKCLAFWNVVCETFRKIVDSKYFGRGIMIAILINTLSMGIEYHEQVSSVLSVHEVVYYLLDSPCRAGALDAGFISFPLDLLLAPGVEFHTMQHWLVLTSYFIPCSPLLCLLCLLLNEAVKSYKSNKAGKSWGSAALCIG